MSIRVLVVDDSAVVRQTVLHLLDGDPELELVGSAPNPIVAAAMMPKCLPDVVLLDVEMPGMDGLTFLRQIMADTRTPTVICSTLATEGSQVAIDAMALGAIAVVAKPRVGLKSFLEQSRRELVAVLKLAARSRPRAPSATRRPPPPALSHPMPCGNAAAPFAINKPVLFGGSTGGTQALEEVLLELPADSPGIAVVQHMPEKFTAMYAHRLDSLCAMQVREARDGDRLERGVVLIAPGARHMQLRKASGQYFVVVADGPPVNHHKPSVDVLFRSAAECAGSDALAVLLTGMGDDGARGMLRLHELGARTIAQDEQSCVVFGMPKEAIRLGAASEVLCLSAIASAVLRFDARK